MQGYAPAFTDVKHLNTRCLRRDLTMAASISIFTAENLLNVTVGAASANVGTFRNNPPSRPGTVDDLLNLGKLGPAIPIKDVLSTLGGTPLCHIYQ